MTVLGYVLFTLILSGLSYVLYLRRKRKKRQRLEGLIKKFEETYPETFVAIDTETSTKRGDVCQLAYAVVVKGEIVKSKSYLVKPFGNTYEKFCTEIHGIKATDTKNSPGIADIWPEFEELIKRYGFVATHNADFHIDAIIKSLKKDGWKSKALYDAEIVDTAALARAPLRYCIKEYGLDIEFKQDALCHALSCAKLLIELRKRHVPITEK